MQALFLAVAIHGDIECYADFAHPIVAKPSETPHEDSDGNALDRVEVDRRPPRNWIVSRLHNNLAGETADRGCTRRNERAPQPWNGRITGKHHDGPPADIR
jgi:hypothetical protein